MAEQRPALVRAFIAIELPQAVIQALAQVETKLVKLDVPVKWVDPRGIHLTLKFLGNVAADAVPDIVQAIAESTRGITPFKLELGQAGAFPSLNYPRVVWVGVKGELNGLIDAQKRLEQVLAALDFPPEDRPFTAHLTLGRARMGSRSGDLKPLSEALAKIQIKDVPPPFVVESIDLMKSTLTPKGAVYEKLAAVKLEKGMTSPLTPLR